MPALGYRLVALSLLVAAAPARADAPPAASSISAEQLAALMHTYYGGERDSFVPFVGTGALTLTAGSLCLAQGQPLERGAAWPLLGVGAIELIAGVVWGVRSPSHVAALDRELAADPQAFARAERHHLRLIRDRNQPILLIAESVLAVGGGGMAIGGAVKPNATLEGVGLGLAVQGLAMFLLDWDILDRARDYSTGLAMFMPDPAEAP